MGWLSRLNLRKLHKKTEEGENYLPLTDVSSEAPTLPSGKPDLRTQPLEILAPEALASETFARGAWSLRLLRKTADLVFPPTCGACGRFTGDEDALCASCWRKTIFLSPPWCARLGLPFAYDLGPDAVSPAAIAAPPIFGRARSAVAFEGPARDMVHMLKYGDRPELSKLMAVWMARAGAELLADRPLLAPVPLHRGRLWRRRYNQAALLARALGETQNAPVRLDALLRQRPTRNQVGLSARARMENVRGAFAVPQERLGEILGRRVVLIDDVYTTGATMNACAKTLLSAGAKEVDVLTFARAHANEPLQ